MQTSTLARRAGAARDVSANVFKKKAKVAAKAKTAAPKRSSSSGEEGLWLPNTARPAWLDGSLPGDRGFDPLGLSKPTEYIQVRGGGSVFAFSLRSLDFLVLDGISWCGRGEPVALLEGGWKKGKRFFFSRDGKKSQRSTSSLSLSLSLSGEKSKTKTDRH